jgi:hypothetical protein
MIGARLAAGLYLFSTSSDDRSSAVIATDTPSTARSTRKGTSLEPLAPRLSCLSSWPT